MWSRKHKKHMLLTKVTQASENLFLIFNIRVLKIKTSEIKSLIVQLSLCEFDCQIQSNSIHGFSLMWFKWVQLTIPGQTLKGHCHAIWQLDKKLEGVFASIEFQNKINGNRLVVTEDFFNWYWNWLSCCLSLRMAWMKMDWNLKKLANFFKFWCYVFQKCARNLLWFKPSLIKFVWYLCCSFTDSEAFCLWFKSQSNDFSTELA